MKYVSIIVFNTGHFPPIKSLLHMEPKQFSQWSFAWLKSNLPQRIFLLPINLSSFMKPKQFSKGLNRGNGKKSKWNDSFAH